MRKYAEFFEWRDREIKELGVCIELLESLNASLSLGLTDAHIHRPDPPDCACRDRAGRLIGVEVVEAVCTEAVRRSAKGEGVVRVWRAGEFGGLIQDLLESKDRKTYLGGPFDEIWVCVFTDEPMLTIEQVKADASNLTFPKLKQIARAFVLMSYDPISKSYPFTELAFRR